MSANRLSGKGLSVGIIGAGPGGLALGIFLRKAGFSDFTIFDREDGVGGTWRINAYPGLACDVKSDLYSYSFDLNANWSRMWSGQPEILEYFERCAQRYELGPNLKLNTEVTSAQWDGKAWQLTTSAGERFTFDVVVSAIGLFTQPVLPDLREDEPFTGTMMHTARCICPGQDVNPGPLFRMPYGTIHPYAVTAPIIGMATGAYSLHVDATRERVRAAYLGEKSVDDPFAQVRIATAAAEKTRLILTPAASSESDPV